MSNNRYPFCSLIVLNYNGENIISDNLNSLLSLKYPKDRYEILVVDNNSQDRSKEILTQYSENYKNIKTFFLDKNLGFSKGNNFGIKKSKGEYVALINNDCILEKDWLKRIITPFLKDNKVFAVNSKILLYSKFIKVELMVNPVLVPVDALLSKSALYNGSESGLVSLQMGKKIFASASDYSILTLELLYEPYKDKSVEFNILFNSRGVKFNKQTDLYSLISFENEAISITNVTLNGDDIEYQINLKLTSAEILRNSLDKIQNAGIFIFQDGYCRDIGAVVSSGRQFYEYDLKQYNREKEVYAACAAAVLYRKEILRKIGLLDESFFMYYEDVEICERARFAGFKVIYNPKAIARHFHALSSKEWSPLFIYHVEKGRLLHIFYNFPVTIFLNEYLSLVSNFLISSFSILIRINSLLYTVRSKKATGAEPKFVRRIQVIKALSYFLINFPIILFKRFKYARLKKRDVVSNNYLKILRGEWYSS